MDMDIEARENSDLLAVNKAEQNGNARADVRGKRTAEPPDGGFKAYAVLVGSFLTNGLLFGIINSCSVMYIVLEKQLIDEGISSPQTRASLVGSLSVGTTFLLSPVSGVLTSLLGLRLTAVLGGSIAAAGLLISSFVTHSVGALYFTYGIMYGMGASFAYTPSLAILGHYFKKRLGLMNGFVTIGSSVFTVIMPLLMTPILNNYGLHWLFRLLAVLTFGVAMCGLLFKPVSLADKPAREDDSYKSLLKNIINIDIWKNRKYKFWALSMPVAVIGYFVPYVYIKKFIMKAFVVDDRDIKAILPLLCIAITSGIGRLFFGFLADKPGMDKIMLQQISFYVIGTLTIILPFVPSYGVVVVVVLGMGVFDGAFIALIGPIACELCGAAHAAQAIGCMLGLAALPLSVGPPIAGALYKANDSYTLAFVLAGITPLVGATLMFATRVRTSRRDPPDANGRALPMSSKHLDAGDAEDIPVPLLTNGKINEQTL